MWGDDKRLWIVALVTAEVLFGFAALGPFTIVTKWPFETYETTNIPVDIPPPSGR
jgi:hypothetical protein